MDIDDLCEHLWFEDLRNVYLVGWSYGAWHLLRVAADVRRSRSKHRVDAATW